jgi:hypothetical protein
MDSTAHQSHRHMRLLLKQRYGGQLVSHGLMAVTSHLPVSSIVVLMRPSKELPNSVFLRSEHPDSRHPE